MQIVQVKKYENTSKHTQKTVSCIAQLTLDTNSAVTLTATVSVEVYLKSKLPVSTADCCDMRSVDLYALFTIIKVISNNIISFMNK